MRRIKEVNSLIKNELSQIILKELDFPKDILTTLTRVESSKDLNQVKIYISTIPSKRVNEVFEVLNKNIYKLQKILNKRLKMRPVPRIVFKKEEKTEEADKIEKILEQLKKEKK